MLNNSQSIHVDIGVKKTKGLILSSTLSMFRFIIFSCLLLQNIVHYDSLQIMIFKRNNGI